MRYKIAMEFPVKYAVLKLGNSITSTYIASKCYVMQTTTTYRMDGTSESAHKVVFPHNDIETFIKNGMRYIGEDKSPDYFTYTGKQNVDTVNDIFDTYEDAKRMANFMNEILKKKVVAEATKLNTPYYENLVVEFENNLKISNLYEQAIELQTADIEVTKSEYKPLIKNTNN